MQSNADLVALHPVGHILQTSGLTNLRETYSSNTGTYLLPGETSRVEGGGGSTKSLDEIHTFIHPWPVLRGRRAMVNMWQLRGDGGGGRLKIRAVICRHSS